MTAPIRDTGTQKPPVVDVPPDLPAPGERCQLTASTAERLLADGGVASLVAHVEHLLAGERARIKRSLTLPTLKALRAIPDGEIRNGCVVMDGGQVRERLRQAYLAIDAPERGEYTEEDR